MITSRKSLFFILALFIILQLPAYAQYNPSKDNPYIRSAGGKKWYEFYKEEQPAGYVQKKNTGYFRSTEQENFLVRGVKWVGISIRDIAQAAVS
jgi:hypothetical protein